MAPRRPLPRRASRLLHPQPPAGVEAHHLERVERRRPFAPAQLRLAGIGMRADAEAADALHILHHVARVAAEWVRRRRHVEGDVMAAVGADFDAVEAEDARPVRGWVGPTR